jgi:(1->4)-alpha-D-glucan 1-alpha-D-glucosylmutase
VVGGAHVSTPRVAPALDSDSSLRETIQAGVESINDPRDGQKCDGLWAAILKDQAYRLACWRTASHEINYRRFFEIDTLAGLRIERPDVFERVHALIFRLVDQGDVDGLRIDHIDGLADPEQYLRAIQDRIGPDFYIAVEKILQSGERLRPWPVAGTTGYDVLNLLDGVLVDGREGVTLERIYRDFGGLERSYDTLVRQAKIEICRTSFAGELEVLADALLDADQAELGTPRYARPDMRQALVETIAAFPHYRSYRREGEPDAEDAHLIERAVASAKEASILHDKAAHDFIAAVLLGGIRTSDRKRSLADFPRRFQQLTGPVMAKSLEDTVFYRYGRLIALNEVGGDPGQFGVTTAQFHEANALRARDWPSALIATATHDTKRGEDARARLLALSEMPDEWRRALGTWSEVVAPHLSCIEGAVAPDGNDQIILFQTLLAACPLSLLDAPDPDALGCFRHRIEAYVVKALREAKRHTSWLEPNIAYEEATIALVRRILNSHTVFSESFRPLLRRLCFLGMLNGLSRTVLKATLPGIPDTYQGAEFWDFALVDPDNRRPVDYRAREDALDGSVALSSLLACWRDGRIKQRILSCLLWDREEARRLYAEGDYQPLPLKGDRARHLIAFARRLDGEALVVIVPRLWANLTPDDLIPVGSPVWHGTAIGLPHGHWRNVFTGETIRTDQEWLESVRLFSDLPFAVLRTVQGLE